MKLFGFTPHYWRRIIHASGYSSKLTASCRSHRDSQDTLYRCGVFVEIHWLVLDNQRLGSVDGGKSLG